MILVANHRSLIDFPVAMALFTRFGLSLHIQIQAAYMKSGVGAKLFHGVGAIPTSRAHRDSSERASIEALERGHLLGVMPEGRLGKPDEWVRGVASGKPGVSRIAEAVGDVVIVPVAVSGAERAWPRGGRPRLGRQRVPVRIQRGEPFELASKDHQDNTVQVMRALSDLLIEMGDEAAVRTAETTAGT